MILRAMFHVKQQRSRDERATTRQRGRNGALLAAAVLAACSSPEEMAAGTGIARAQTPAPPAVPPAPVPAPARTVFTDNAARPGKEGEARREFSYAWPAQVAAVPQLVARFTAERDRLLSEQKADWDEALREFAEGDCFGCINRSFEKGWEVVADLPGYLSLSASFYQYSGGAHGNGAYDALVWDRSAKAALDPKAMFDPDALQQALGAPWCARLKAERRKRLGTGYSDDGFFACPAIKDLTVLVGSSDKRRFNRIGLLAAPYVAGSYAEGTYEVTLPVTSRVLAAVKPQYRAAFAPGK